MANWQRRINITTAFEQCNSGEIPVYQLCRVIKNELLRLRPFNIDYIDEGKNDIIVMLDELIEAECTEFDDFNDMMSNLYDWADIKFDNKAVCWIEK